LYERIPGANKNKTRQDHAVELDWYHDPREPKQSALLEIANLRALRSLGRRADLFDTFFPSEIDSTDARRYLLEMTRHTPRDFLRLLFHIQEFSGPGRLSVGAIKSGLRDYSIKYFLPEIQDELSGYATPEEISRMIGALGRLRKRDFRLEELIHASATSSKSLSAERVHEIVEALFNCSALGNIQHRQGGTTFYTFKYRNRHSSFNEGESIMLHRGLWKSLNVI
jgi:hypothetical protein